MKWCSNIYIYVPAPRSFWEVSGHLDLLAGQLVRAWNMKQTRTSRGAKAAEYGDRPLQHQEESPIWFVTTILDSSHSDRNTQPVGSETAKYGEAHEGWGSIWKDRNHRFWRCAQAYRRVGALSGGSSKLIHYVWHRLLFLLYNWTSAYYTAALKLYFCNTVVYIIHCEA